MRRSHLWLFVAFVLILAACGGTSADETTTTTTTVPTTTTTTSATTTTTEAPTTTTTEELGPVSPLNGLPAEDPTLLERGVLAVKIDNHWKARPQSGLQTADAIYELPVEGVTRFIALVPRQRHQLSRTNPIGPTDRPHPGQSAGCGLCYQWRVWMDHPLRCVSGHPDDRRGPWYVQNWKSFGSTQPLRRHNRAERCCFRQRISR